MEEIKWLEVSIETSPKELDTLTAQLIMNGAEGLVIEVEVEGTGALVGVVWLPSDEPSGIDDDFQNLWDSVFGVKAMRGREESWSGDINRQPNSSIYGDESYYIKGRPSSGNPKVDKLIRKDRAQIKSHRFIEFLESIGETPSKWKK